MKKPDGWLTAQSKQSSAFKFWLPAKTVCHNTDDWLPKMNTWPLKNCSSIWKTKWIRGTIDRFMHHKMEDLGNKFDSDWQNWCNALHMIFAYRGKQEIISTPVNQHKPNQSVMKLCSPTVFQVNWDIHLSNHEICKNKLRKDPIFLPHNRHSIPTQPHRPPTATPQRLCWGTPGYIH